ncbi:phosphoribosylanthranilate isomerase [Hippea maritima]|uniref:N-(5'-phosphoribosyl)anthranilate isomerase n=1 Tax=Hippea maritima (strain ATCC 700847 / DSM 10411 / MH2) TaxID=760142 RepID=F2LU57_HIPMA|nr:phosphoribosylanthranilate isomerase [Hippea maritima]AEA34520.1 Phosphoribosylanthranilate isomerase [Hippea maritima DSM 10411]
MKVKFCGMTNYDDVKAAIELGVDFIGFVFYPKSKRFISFEEAKRITERIKGEVKTVGIFVNQNEDQIKKAVDFLGLDYAQVYVDVGVKNTIRVYRIKDKLPEVRKEGLLLFDAYTEKIGGAAKSFNWDMLKGFKDKDRLFVAGGINAENVQKIKSLDLFGVDLVSGIEAYPGKKDISKMKEFLEVARSKR